MQQVTPVILCGGSGTRLWPLSRKGFPKQFLALAGDDSLFQQAVTRLNNVDQEGSLMQVNNTLILTNESHRFLALEQLRELGDIKGRLILEPIGRNTAPALTLAALEATRKGEDPILLVSPADQVIQDESAFNAALNSAIEVAADGAIVVLGIAANKPETGYGYIKRSGESGKFGEYDVAAFVEKPDLEIAKSYIDSGEYAWNGGLFVVKASVWLKAIEQFRNDILKSVNEAWQTCQLDEQFIRFKTKVFKKIPEESIDYAVVERCPGSEIAIKVVPLDAGWSDLGAWDALWCVSKQDEHGNCISGDAITVDTHNTLVYSESRLISTVGVDGLVVVETADAVLVAHKDKCQDVKKVVQHLKEYNRDEQDAHRKVQRPWGWYDSIDECERFKVKRIMVKPGASLSLQKHHHRAEHWIVVKGTAEVTCGEKISILTENQSTYIPLGEVHRLVNPGSIPLEIIEVQSGSYLGEDDIVRLEDSYGRVKK